MFGVMTIAEVTAPQQRVVGRPFKPGQSGNPKGRPLGARAKLGEAFLEALRKDFEKHGLSAIVECRTTKPDAYLRTIAAILPEQIEINKTEFVVLVPADVESVEEWLLQSGVNRSLTAQ